MDNVRLKPTALWESLVEVPLVKASLSLMTGTIVTSALGLVFWILAAQLYEPADLGVSATAVYTMMMIADVACLGLRTGLVRFVPNAGLRTGRTIVWGYSMVVAASSLVAIAFLAGLGWWAPELGALRNTLLLAVFFVGSTVCWALFMLEDAVLVGLRRAPWVPVENTLFGLLKIALLIPFATWSPGLGIFWAWVLPVFPIVIGVNILMARLPEARSGGTAADPEISRLSNRSLLHAIITFSLADWLAAVARLVALGVIPLIVLARLGREFAAYFQVSWLIAFVIFSLSANAAYALLAESSYEKSQLNRHSLQALGLSLGLTVPVAFVGLVGAGLLLRIYGADYAANSANTLRILLVAAVPNVIHQLYIGRLRSQGRMATVMALETVLSIVVLGLVWVLIPGFGLSGVALAWLLGLSLMAAYAVASESLWWWADRLDTRLIRWASSAARRARWDRPARGLNERLRPVLEVVGHDGGPVAAEWEAGDDNAQRAVVALDPAWNLVVDFARSEAGGDEIVHTGRVLTELMADETLAPLRPLLPRPAAEARGGPGGWVAWRQPVAPTAAAMVTSDPTVRLVPVIADALAPLHDGTALPILVDEEQVGTWIDESLARLGADGRSSEENLVRLRRRLVDGFAGRVIDVGVIHGALTLPNALVGGGPAPRVVGLTGWDRSTTMPIIVDRATLALSDLSVRAGVELGEMVARLLADPTEFEQHPAFASPGATGGGANRGAIIDPDARSVILLAWLQLVGAPAERSRALFGDLFWLARNARPVLACLQSYTEVRS